jgi:hypothetical protein
MTQADDSFGSIVNLYDSEMAKALDLWNALKLKAEGRSIDRDAFNAEIRNRFAEECGLVVSVKWWTCGTPMPDGTVRELPGVYKPEIEITARTETRGQFDHDRMAWEVQNNILELQGQQKGKISSKEGAELLAGVTGHKHGADCDH